MSILYYVPEIFSYVINGKIKIGNSEMNFLEIIFDTLNFTLVIFSEFYVVNLKINSGFVGKEYLLKIFQNYGISFSSENSDIQIIYEKIFN